MWASLVGCSHPQQPKPQLAPLPDDTAAKATADAAPAPAAKATPERWAATVVAGATLIDFVVVFTDPTATLEVGGKSLPLADVTHATDSLAFTVQKPGLGEDKWEHYTLARQGDVAVGTSKIGAFEAPAKMVKLGADEAPHSAFARPQEAALARPFPYEERELVIDAPDGGKLAGTLTVPAVGKAPFPVVLLLSGSGQQDRDETIFGHKPYLLVSDALTRAGFATYRFDDRGTGKTVGAPVSLDTEIADAGAVIDALKKQRDVVDPKRVGVMGHSAGGVVAPLAAVKHPVAFVVLLAGTTLPGSAYAAYQTEHALRAAGATEAQVKEQQAAQAKMAAAIVKGKAAVEAALTELVTPQLAKALGHAPTKEEVASAIAKPLAQSTDPWTVSYFKLDPRVAWAKLAVPVLLVVGDKDTQVPADLTIAGLVDATKGRKTVTTKKLAGLNHLFQHARTGEVDEYLQIDETMSPDVLALLVDWLSTQAKLKK